MNQKYLKRTYKNHREAFAQAYGVDSTLAFVIDAVVVLVCLWLLYQGVGTVLTILSVVTVLWILFDRGRQYIGGLRS